jgi:hypothetical protein
MSERTSEEIMAEMDELERRLCRLRLEWADALSKEYRDAVTGISDLMRGGKP